MSHPATDTVEVAEAKTYLDALKKSFSSTWHGTERTLQHLMQVLERQTQQIHNLEENTHMLERQVQEKYGMVNALETRITELESHVNAKDRELVEVKHDNDKLKAAFTRAVTRCREFQNKISEMEANHQNGSAEIASLRVKLVEAEERAAAAGASEKNAGNGVSKGLSEDQLKRMEAALKKELETRNDVVRKAAQEAIVPLRNAYVASQARVKELEEQLQKFQSCESVATHTSVGNSGPNDEGPSLSTPSYIVSGKYRPKPSPALFGQDNNAAAGSRPAPAAISHPTQINPLYPSTVTAQEVIDLTELDNFPDTTNMTIS